MTLQEAIGEIKPTDSIRRASWKDAARAITTGMVNADFMFSTSEVLADDWVIVKDEVAEVCQRTGFAHSGMAAGDGDEELGIYLRVEFDLRKGRKENRDVCSSEGFPTDVLAHILESLNKIKPIGPPKPPPLRKR